MIIRKKTKQIKLGNVLIGDKAPITVQSMTNTDTRDIEATVKQIKELEEAGCELIRVAVVDEEAANAIFKIKKQINIPIIADIHFNHKLALLALKNEVDGLRLNPGNIGSKDKVKEIVVAAQDKQVPIRIGVNSGSLDKSILNKYNGITSEALVSSAMEHMGILEDLNFTQIKISLKSSNVPLMLDAYRILSQKVDYPLHLGVTESGTINSGIIKSAVGIGTLLAEGIGDTIRVSLTGNPVPEIKVAYDILKSLDLRKKGVEIISCPTCGRCQIDLANIADEIEKKLSNVKKPLKIAVMGCVVNGPGEAQEADLGIAGGKDVGILFKHGKIIAKLPQDQLVDALLKEVDSLI